MSCFGGWHCPVDDCTRCPQRISPPLAPVLPDGTLASVGAPHVLRRMGASQHAHPPVYPVSTDLISSLASESEWAAEMNPSQAANASTMECRQVRSTWASRTSFLIPSGSVVGGVRADPPMPWRHTAFRRNCLFQKCYFPVCPIPDADKHSNKLRAQNLRF